MGPVTNEKDKEENIIAIARKILIPIEKDEELLYLMEANLKKPEELTGDVKL